MARTRGRRARRPDRPAPDAGAPRGRTATAAPVGDVREARATARYIRISPFKARRAADLIRRQSLTEARRRLAFSTLRSSRMLSKVVESAAANATNNYGMDEDRLYVHTAYVDEGVTLKRWSPAAYGRAYRIRKRTSHMTVVLRESEGR